MSGKITEIFWFTETIIILQARSTEDGNARNVSRLLSRGYFKNMRTREEIIADVEWGEWHGGELENKHGTPTQELVLEVLLDIRDLLQPEIIGVSTVDKDDFLECDTCRAKPGSPTLCAGCLHNRALISRFK